MSVAAGLAGLTAIGLCVWLMHGSGSADAAARAGVPSVFGTIHPPLLSYGPDAPQADPEHAPRVRLASLDNSFDARFASAGADDSPEAPATAAPPSSFEERFFFDGSTPLTSLRPQTSFEDRFGAAGATQNVAPRSGAPAPLTTASVAAPAAPARNVAPPAPRLVATVPLPRPAPRSQARYQVASLSETPVPASYAPPDAAPKEAGITGLLSKLTMRDQPAEAAPQADTTPKEPNPLEIDPAHTAVYDISARRVYLPSGERLEAHSGLGGYMDDVHAVSMRKIGPTPPNVYELKLREARFHGVQAIRLIPVDGSKMYGRDGILAHPFMMGPEGASNGCVSIKDYPAFLKAYMSGEITRIVVVEQLDEPPGGRTAADWFRKIFGRS